MNSKKIFAATSLLLAGALALSYGCASEESTAGGSGGNDSKGGAGSSGSSSSTPSGGGSSGSSTSTPSGGGGGGGDEITFKTGQAQGMFTGYAWVALGEKDSLTSPTCDTGNPITKSSACTTSTVWSKEDAVCMSGSIPALPATPVQADYDNNWGVQIGVNAKEPSDEIGSALAGYATVTFTLSGSPSSGLRAMLHRKGDPDGTTYCADSIKSGIAIKLTSFNTKCWGEATTVKLVADDLPKIDKIGVQVSSTSAPIEVKDLCLEKIVFSK